MSDNSKVILIIGACGGIGQCLCRNFLKQGAKVIGIDIKECTDKDIDFFRCDISCEPQVCRTFEEISAKYRSIDVLINSAGIIARSGIFPIEDMPYEEWTEVMQTNLDGTFLVVRESIPLLKRSTHKGCIISLSSEQVSSPSIGSAPYAISKAGIEMLTKILAVELLEFKIRVNALELASVRDNFIEPLIRDLEQLKTMSDKRDREMPFGIIEVEDVFSAVEYLIRDSTRITGQVVMADSGYTLI